MNTLLTPGLSSFTEAIEKHSRSSGCVQGPVDTKPKRLANSEDELGSYVRHLKIVTGADEQWFYFGIYPMLQDVVINATGLQSLTWNMHYSTGTEYGNKFLDRFHKTHPSAKLTVICRHRSLTPMDRALLSSPQLYAVDISVLYSGDMISTVGELQMLKKCLSDGDSVKVLCISFQMVLWPIQCEHNDPRPGFKNWEGLEDGPCNFQWKKEDRFPSLHKLVFGDGHYRFTPDHCYI
jgi:hypothetical protein